MKTGFIPALGTPLDMNGYVVERSLRAHVENQIQAGCAGLLVMGSMGIQAAIRSKETVKIAQLVIEQNANRVPVFVGVMDCSIHRAHERMEEMEDLDITAFVFTAPYYNACKREQIMTFFRGVSSATKHNIMLYDLPGVTQSKITYDMVVELKRDLPNLLGIKTADIQMIRKLKLLGEVPSDFITCYSGLDTFDICYKWGIENYLDGMISCCPANFSEMDKAFKKGDFKTAGTCVNHVVSLRDLFFNYRLMPCFTAAMNFLGFEGNFNCDYDLPISAETAEIVRIKMIEIGEL